MQNEFNKYGSGILVHVGKPEKIWPKLLQQFEIAEVYTNHDYEPYGKNRDQSVADYLSSEGIAFKTYKDQVIFEKSEVTKDDGKPYTVFTPYKNKWKATLQRNPLPSYPSENHLSNLYKTEIQIPKLEEIGFQPSGMLFPGGLKSESLQHLEKLIEIFDLNRPLNHINKIKLVAGDAKNTIPDYIKSNPELVCSLLWLDFDIYEGTKVAIENILPRMPKGAVIAFDELNHPLWPGETVALIDTIGINNLRIKRMLNLSNRIVCRIGKFH